MRKVQWFLQLTLLMNLMPGIVASQIDTERATEQELREVQEVATAFMCRMTETRDVASLKDLFLADYVKRRVEAERASLGPGQSFPLLPSIPISLERDLLPGVSEQDWERFYNAKFNLRYLWLLTLASRFNLVELERQPPASDLDIFPPRVSALVRSNRFLAADHTGEVAGDRRHIISTLEEFCALTTTLEQATAILREEFLKNPPEETSTYKDNLSSRPEREGSGEWMRQPYLYRLNESVHGSPKGTRLFYLRTTPEFFELTLVKTDSGIKIVSAAVYPFN